MGCSRGLMRSTISPLMDTKRERSRGLNGVIEAPNASMNDVPLWFVISDNVSLSSMSLSLVSSAGSPDSPGHPCDVTELRGSVAVPAPERIETGATVMPDMAAGVGFFASEVSSRESPAVTCNTGGPRKAKML